MFKISFNLSGIRAINCIKSALRLASNLSPNYYNVLELKPRSSEDKIKDAYYELSKKYHPDKNLGDELATKKFLEINEAFEVLGNKSAKVQYDETFFPVKTKPINKMHFIYEQSEFYEPPITDNRIYRKRTPYTGIKYEQYARHSKGAQKRRDRHARQKYEFCKNMSSKRFSFLY